MTCNIIALGPTGRQWDGNGYSIGVNDVWRYGKPTDAILCVNVFASEPDRERIVSESRPKYGFYSGNIRHWMKRPDYIRMQMRTFYGKYEKGQIYTSKSSPFIAVTLAACLGFDEIILWGVDMIDHKILNGKLLDFELQNWKDLYTGIGKCGIKLYLAKDFGALKDIIPVYGG